MYHSGMPEYRQNGVYEIDGIFWYTIWAYKGMFHGHHATPEINTEDSNRLSNMGFPFIITIPDRGPFPEIKAYREEDIRSLIG